MTDQGLDTAAPLSEGRRRQLEDTIPKTRANLTFNHYAGAFRGLVRVNYYGKFFECHLDATNSTPPQYCDLPHDGGAQFPIDVELGVEVIDGVEFIAGAQNVFDSYPDPLEPSNAGVAGSKYPPIAPAGFLGGFYYFKVRAEF